MAAESDIDNARGAVWMTANALFFSASAATIRHVAQELPVAEIVFMRCVLGMLVLVPALVHRGFAIYRTESPKLHIIRMVCATINLYGYYYGVAHLPLAAAVSLNFTRPLFSIILAVTLLHETVRWRRGLATVIGFIGVVVMLGPSGLGFDTASIVTLIGAAAVAGAVAVIRQQAAIDGPLTLFAWFVTGTAILTLPAALVSWVAPTPTQWALLTFIGIASGLGQYFLIKALTYGELSVMSPIDYLQIVLAGVFGYVLFDELPGVWTAVGAAIIIGSTLYIILREGRLKKQRSR
jgi:drug/metabolite transporter (DMT)-like permease